MDDRAALLAAIRAEPRDYRLRLVYADCLEENGDEDGRELAAFIRLQCRLAPLRADCHDETLAALHRDEELLLGEHRERWLGEPLSAFREEDRDPPAFEFRGGLLEQVTLSVDSFLSLAESLVVEHSAFHDLRLFDLHERCEALAACPQLQTVRVLALFPYEFTDEDAAALAGSPFFNRLDVLHVWVFGLEEARRCLQIASLPTVREVWLHHVWGGIESGSVVSADREFVALSREFEALGSARVRLARPHARLFPLNGDIWTDLYAGHTSGGRQTLVLGGRTSHLFFFDDSGHFVEEQECPLDDVLVTAPDHPWEEYNEGELLDVLAQRFGFELGLIHVREFSAESVQVGLPFLEGGMDRILYWAETGNFQITVDGGDSWWAGPRGKVHTT